MARTRAGMAAAAVERSSTAASLRPCAVRPRSAAIAAGAAGLMGCPAGAASAGSLWGWFGWGNDSGKISFEYTVEVPMCSDACGKGVGDPEHMCAMFKEGCFFQHVKAEKCQDKEVPEGWEDQIHCYGSEPTSAFCESCTPDGVAPCRRCAPGFRLDGFECKNDGLQVALEIAVPEHLHNDWQQTHRPTLAECLVRAIGAIRGAGQEPLAVSPYAVRSVSTREKSYIVIDAAVALPQDHSVASALQLREDLQGQSLVVDAACPAHMGIINATVLCPGAQLTLPDGSCPARAHSAARDQRRSWPLKYWDTVGLVGVVVVLSSYIALERRRRGRELLFAEAATNHARRSAEIKEAQMVQLASRDQP